MSEPLWTDVVSAVGSAVTPLAVVAFGLVITRRQSRSELLQRTRLEYYTQLVPDLNWLMCYMTFIGTWRDDSPVDIVDLKRRLDSRFNVAAPLFSAEVTDAYRALMKLSFRTFGGWGEDAVIRTGAFRRRSSWRRKDIRWNPHWDKRFERSDETTISAEELTTYRGVYDDLLAALVKDLDITRARAKFTTSRVRLNASAPVRTDIAGAS
ncbi:hypothetical protein CLV46_2521 [Diaminobutyricimonas aerilata]|uniref:Uncharacterized protein n=1 Tax=Diaminobutyricimonas aerilata TaxID=1162967 RepID=A0A2M9CM23_9MICO|nr:hypothetical protein [Diaminobutyricimonas aerilata]PJJ72942.1 hypothetical protein CLV46_2521 [Diaminobutyricimonas aerilata]